MATERIVIAHTAAKTVYLVVRDELNNFVLDHSDNTLKLLADATTPGLAMTERTDGGGVGRSNFFVDLNLANVNKQGHTLRCLLTAYEQAGGSPAPLTDTVVSAAGGLDVRFSMPAGKLVAHAELSVKSTLGSAAQCTVWLEQDGQLIDVDAVDASARATLRVVEHKTGKEWTASGSSVQLDTYQFEKTAPAFVDDRQYTLIASIEEMGNRHTSTHNRVVIG